MGRKAEHKLDLKAEDLREYLLQHHSVYMVHNDTTYYITDVNDSYWRAQDTARLNEKGHYTDCSDLVSCVSEFLELPFCDGQPITAVFDEVEFFASEK